ncbi:MAG: DsbA family protein, partial [Planctomycetota bacterium]|nr:DsbA family protein [Planctomycetota bacterium]
MPHAASRKIPTPPAPTPDQKPANLGLFAVAMVLCLTGLVASIALVLKHFGAVSLPGCGTGGGCEAASASIWGSIYGVPVSIIGTAHFLAMLTIVVLNKGRVSNIVVWGMRLAAAASLIYVGIALGANLICAYCIAIHIANVLLSLTLSSAGSGTNYDWKRQVAIGAVAATAAYGFLLPLNYRVQVTAQKRAETLLAESTAQITAQAAQKPSPAAPQGSQPATQTPQAKPNTDAAAPAKAAEAPVAAAPEAPKVRPLDGRYRFGPDVASVRIVMFTDYQCPDCYKIEQELKALMQSTPGLSVGIRYFPLSNKCNPAMGTSDLHPNACWAARAAETAGMLKGADGFWQMHHWLFDRKGGFTDAELVKGLAELGYDPVGFQKIMMSEETKKRVAEDVEFGQSLGIYFTPMIFINGVELRGWKAPKALTRAVTAAVAANPPPVAVGQDQPPDARSKYFEDWRAQPKVSLPPAVSR